MKMEKISDQKFLSFEITKISKLHKILGGAAESTPAGQKQLGGDSCTMTYTSDTQDGDVTTYHGATYSGTDCPE